MTKYTFLSVILLVGCSSTSVNTPDETGGSAGIGGENSGGSGGNSGSAGNSTGGTGGESDGGIDSSGGTGGVCIPKTCLEIEFNNPGVESCDIIEDGCGGFEDCGGCSNTKEACGADRRIKGTTDLEKGVSNICSNFCTNFGFADTSKITCGIGCLQETVSTMNCSGGDGWYECPCEDWE